MTRSPRRISMALTVAVILAAALPAAADPAYVPVPKVMIYPGDGFSNDTLTDAPAASLDIGANDVRSRAELLGKVAQRTLLPGRPIPLQALTNPRVVRSGSAVKMLYVDGGLRIEASGTALQDGGVGDLIHLRNADSGVAVDGRIQVDGTVLVGG